MVNNHYSLRSTVGNRESFQEMFPDSEIPEKFALSAGKLSYIIHHGLPLYFKMRIMEELSPKHPRLPPKFTSCFDESFNKVTCSKQMDVHLLYYKEEMKQIELVYLGSQVMDRGTANNIMDDFKEYIKN